MKKGTGASTHNRSHKSTSIRSMITTELMMRRRPIFRNGRIDTQKRPEKGGRPETLEG